MPFIDDYKIVEHTWKTGFQYTEQTNNGYRLRLKFGKREFYSEPIKNLDEAMELLDELKGADGK